MNGPTSENGRDSAGTRNELSGTSGATVQAGTVHGGITLGGTRPPWPRPRQLPMDIPLFVNREADIERLHSLLPAPAPATAPAPRNTVAIATITGPPGMGKTALALHWAHRVRGQFPDGDLYLNMRGHGCGRSLDAAQALDSLLRALDVSPDRIPHDLDSRSALFRSLLDGKRVLIVIDDAASANDVRPLLPASPTCLVVLTSRNSMPGIGARYGAERMTLDTLPPDQSVELLARIMGRERVAAEPDAAARLAERCAHLPLALQIMAEKANEQPYATLAELVEQLADERDRLDALGFEDDELADVRAVFSTSYRALPPEAARMFRLLGLHPGPEMSLSAVAALLGARTTETEIRQRLNRLAQASLVQHAPGRRLRLHDLLHDYAAERAEHDEAPADRDRALRRVLAWYLRTVAAGHRVILPSFHDVPLPDPAEDEPPPLSFADVEQAMDWFEQERLTLLDALRTALRTGRYDLAWRLPAVMYGFFELRHYWQEWQEIHRLGIEAARRAADRYGEACNHLGLGDAHWLLGRLPDALAAYRRAAELGRAEGDGWIAGFALRGTAAVLLRRGEISGALATTRESIEVFRAHGERRGEGQALLTLAQCQCALGEHEQERESARRAVELFTALQDAWSVAFGACALARACGELGQYAEALRLYRDARKDFEEFGNRRNTLRALVGISESLQALGSPEAAAHWREAARLSAGLDEPQAAGMRDRIARALAAQREEQGRPVGDD
ncbi:NB-ARC domain-containing protein [Streptomyces sp. YIM 98790]|uniref:ATP-binding protein n=1 Tax=Streptomyces sp. YIM 98790 TaxID=2689077 RepID=UPI00140A56AD|nr:NB-ARC domain-containing protein [Streptomyces sp. YIM 98790]